MSGKRGGEEGEKRGRRGPGERRADESRGGRRGHMLYGLE